MGKKGVCGVLYSKLQKIGSLSHAERSFVLRAVFWLIRIKLALKFQAYRIVLRKVGRWADRSNTSGTVGKVKRRAGRSSPSYPPLTGLSPPEMGILLEKCARNLPLTLLCLPKALAGYILFRRLGIEVQLRIGAKHSLGEAFAAHAWLELDGVVLVGDLPGLDGFALFEDQRDFPG